MIAGRVILAYYRTNDNCPQKKISILNGIGYNGRM